MDAKIVAITPDMIELKDGLTSTFGQFEPEVAAASIVELCQILGGWLPFTQDQAKRIYLSDTNKDGDFDDYFSLLVERGFLDRVEDMYLVTDRFVIRCFGQHPNKKFYFSD